MAKRIGNIVTNNKAKIMVRFVVIEYNRTVTS